MRALPEAIFFLLISILFVPSAFSETVLDSGKEKQLVLIHLDAVSTDYFLQELHAGNLPNIEAFFGEGGRIDNTVTYFPSKTPTIISSIRLGKSVRETDLPGWEWLMDATDQLVIRTSGTFLRMVFSTSRVSRTTIIYGIPAFHWIAGPALINIADYLNDYPVTEFYWYNVDTQGHFLGREAYLEQIRYFDRQFGRLARRLPPDVNVIIYSDHGMAFGEGVEIDDEVKALLGDEVKIYSFPTLYIRDASQMEQVARALVDSTQIDYTFFETGSFEVRGIHKNGDVTITQDPEDGGIRYAYEADDIFGYSELGYQNEFLSEEEWLALTYQSDYPMAPVLIFEHLKNRVSGDILTLFRAGKYHKTDYGSKGNHGGFTREEMTVPLLVKGDQVSHLAERSYYHLPNLFQDIEEIGFNSTPPRDRHTVSYRTDFRKNQQIAGVTLSPSYRIRYGASFYDFRLREPGRTGSADVFGKGDLFRSYLNRFWFGGGMSFDGNESRPFLLIRHDLHIRRVVIQNYYTTHRAFEFRLNYEFTPHFILQTVNLTSLGIRIDF